MRIEYENTFLDIVGFTAVHQLLSPALQGFYLLFFVYMFWTESLDSAAVPAALTAFLWYLVVWIAQFAFNAIYLISRKNKNILTNHTVEILDDSFLEETKFNKSFFYWPGVVKAVSRPGFIAVYVSQHLAHVIPNRAFATPDQRARFLTLTQEKIRAAAEA